MPAPRISVIIVNYNAGERLARCIAHLDAQSVRDFEIILVDNASTDKSLGAARGRKDVEIIEANENLGFAAGNNLAVKNARGEWLAFLNPDAYPAPDWLEKFWEAVDRYPDIDAFGSLQLNAAATETLDGAGDVCHGAGLIYRGGIDRPATLAPQEGEVFSPCAAAAFYRKETFVRLGGFDERFFCYGEDVDLGFRLRRTGGRALQLREAIVLHEGSGVTGRYSDFSIYHGVRNRIWVYAKNLRALPYYGAAPLRFIVNFAMFVRAAVAGYGGAYWRGYRDGVKGAAAIRRSAAYNLRSSDVARIRPPITWSPRKLLRREPDIRPYRNPGKT